jgi:hypothetical protein
MDRCCTPRIKPVSGKIERRAIAILKSKHIAIKILGAFKVERFDRVMLQFTERHGILLV